LLKPWRSSITKVLYRLQGSPIARPIRLVASINTTVCTISLAAIISARCCGSQLGRLYHSQGVMRSYEKKKQQQTAAVVWRG
jgi:hypothetical protein